MTKMGQGMETKLRKFFDKNPDAQLTYDEARRKFGCTSRQLTIGLYLLRASGAVTTPRVIRSSDGFD